MLMRKIGTKPADAIPAFQYRQSASTSDSDPFTLVARKKKSRRNQHGGTVKDPTPADKVEKSMAELRSDEKWMEKCTQIIRDAVASLPTEIGDILCLGLGSPTESAQARFQFCFLLELRDRILPSRARICAFDPVFSQEDTLLLTSFGIQILEDNKQGRHKVEGPTLAFMPHCDRELYENFLLTNYNYHSTSLAQMLLIGNDLRGYYVDNISTRVLVAESPCISRLAPLLASTPLPEHRAFPNAFSSTAVQHINTASLPDAAAQVSSESGMWQLAGEDPIGCGPSRQIITT